MADRRYLDHGLRKLRRGVASHLTKRPFNLSDLRSDIAFDDDFRGRRYHEINSLGAHDFDWLSAQCASEFKLVHSIGSVPL